MVTSGSQTTWGKGEIHPREGHECCEMYRWVPTTVADAERGMEPTLKPGTLLGRTSQRDGTLTTTSCSAQHCDIHYWKQSWKYLSRDITSGNESFTSPCEMGKWEVNSKEKSLFCGFTMKLKRKIIFKCLDCKASQSKSLGSFFTDKKDMPDSSFKSYSKCPLALQLWSGKQQIFTLLSDNFQLPFRFRMFCIRKIRTKIFKLHIIK